MDFYPMKMRPAYKDYLWGGDALKRVYGKKSGFCVTAESWELSCHPGGTSVISNGAFSGTGFYEFINENPAAVGRKYKGDKLFPVLIKFLDVSTMLSVQVHPSDETAKEGEEGKAEVWYIVDAAPGAYIYYGLSGNITRAEFERRVSDGSVCDVLKRVDAEPGQIWFITPGVLHSAGGGVLVAEVQQSSNTTFRAYDFDRADVNGKKRELHLSRVLDVMEVEPVKSEDMRVNSSVYADGYVFDNLFECGYFSMDRIRLSGRAVFDADGESFHALLCISGCAEIRAAGCVEPISAGDCFFLPAGLGIYELEGKAELLLTRL